MTSVFLAEQSTVRVLKDGAASDECWASLSDGLAPFIVRSSELFVELPLAGADRWLWWFASSDAGEWDWEPRLLERLAWERETEHRQESALELSPEAQARWPDDIDLAELGIVRHLTEPQLRDVARMLTVGGGANFSVPGAGKTTMAYAVWAGLKSRHLVDRCLVVAPLSAHESWATEPDQVFDAGHRPTIAIRPRSPHGEFVVVNYEHIQSESVLERFRTWCSAGSALVIFDEAHRVKAGARGVRGSAARSLSRVATHRITLTGTPRPNSSIDLENVLDLAYPGRGISLARGPVAKLRSAYARTTKAELGLPELITQTESIPMSPAHEAVYGAMVDATARELLLNPRLTEDLARAGRIAMLLLQAATDPTAVLDVGGHLRMVGDRSDLDLEELIARLPSSFIPTKFVRATQLVDQHHRSGSKVVLWTCFRHHVSQLQRLLEPYEPAVVDGGVPVADPAARTDRLREIARFRGDPDCTVLIATPHTLSEGISLHRTTTHQIHLDRTFNAGMFLQSLDRTHRLGLPSDAECTATFLVAERHDRSATVDAIVASRLEAKIAAMGRILDDPGLEQLALPDLDDELRPDELLLGPGGAADLAELFGHIVYGDRR